MLVDASTFPAVDLYQLNGSAINLQSIGTDMISIRYEHDLVSDEPPGSVMFAVTGGDGSFTHLETSSPYTLLGDKRRGRKYARWSPAAGVFTLTVNVYAGNVGDGALLQTFVSTLSVEGAVTAAVRETSENDETRSNRSGDATFDATAVVVVSFAVLTLVVVVVAAVMRKVRQRSQGAALELTLNELYPSDNRHEETQRASFVGLPEETNNNFEWDFLAGFDAGEYSA